MPNLKRILRFVESKGVIPYKLNIKEINQPRSQGLFPGLRVGTRLGINDINNFDLG